MIMMLLKILAVVVLLLIIFAALCAIAGGVMVVWEMLDPDADEKVREWFARLIERN